MPVLLLGITGGIAAYKAAELTSLLRKGAWDVHVVMTEAATRFITPLTLATLSRNPVHGGAASHREPQTGIQSIFDPAHATVDHVDMARRADAVAVVPATADLLARYAAGMADDALTTMLLATTAPVLVAPAMNPAMWLHPALQANLATLRSRGVTVIEPVEGEVACGEFGVGKLAPVEAIASAIQTLLTPLRDLEGVRVLVSAGGTIEPLDPVRFLGNRSSGKMGRALASEAARRGARVTLVAANVTLAPPPGIEVVPVSTAGELADALEARFADCDVLVMAAAVADYRPATVRDRKRKGKEPWLLELVPNPDLLATLAARKRPHQFLVGFAAETRDLLAEAARKLAAKGVDLMVANDVSVPGIGFGSDENAVALLAPEGMVAQIARTSKAEVAARIWDCVAARRGRVGVG